MTALDTSGAPRVSSNSSVAKTVAGLVLCLGVGSLPFPVWDNELADTRHLVANEVIYWILVALVLAHVRRVEGLPLASIGLRRPSWRDALIAALFAIAIVAGLGVILLVVFPALHVDMSGKLDRMMAAPGWWLLISVVRAGVSEEILFRGYPIERLQAWTGSRFVAAIVPLAAFSLAHVGSWGWSHLVVAAFGGGMLTVLYLWRRNLWANIVAHCIVDGVAFLS